MSNTAQCQIILPVNADWNRVRRIYTRLIEKKDQGYFNDIYEGAYKAHVHSINRYGAIVSDSTYNLVDHVWNSWIGDFLTYVLPKDIVDFSDKLLEANLNFKNFGYFVQHGDIREHVDSIPKSTMDNVPFENKTGEHCNINYIISATDLDAWTYVKNPSTGIEERYPTIVGKTFLLDTSIPHGVKNTGTREILQIRVLSPYDEVKEFLIKNNMVL